MSHCPEACDILVDEIMSLASKHGFVAVRITHVFRGMGELHVDFFHFWVNRNEHNLARRFHHIWTNTIGIADAATAFAADHEPGPIA